MTLDPNESGNDSHSERLETVVDAPSVAPADQKGVPLWELAGLFLRLGLTAFGGPAAHLALMRQEVVERRHWLTSAEFLDLIGTANLIPGPSSTEVAILIGLQKAGWRGLLLAGLCFILPAASMVSLLAWVYTLFGNRPSAEAVLQGVKPIVLVIVAQALWSLGRTAVKSKFMAAVGLAATAAALCNIAPVAILFGAGGGFALRQGMKERPKRSDTPLLTLLLLIAALTAGPILLGRWIPSSAHPGPFSLFLVFLKLGSVVYGSGYVLLAFLHSDLVAQRGWLSSSQLLDAVAVGQVTPGPVFTTATFLGYLLLGPRGALIATVGMFLPAFLFVAVSGPLVPRLRRSPLASAFMNGVTVAALGLMAAVLWQLGQDALRDIPSIGLVGVSAFLLLRCRVNATYLILGGALFGFASLLLHFHPR